MVKTRLLKRPSHANRTVCGSISGKQRGHSAVTKRYRTPQQQWHAVVFGVDFSGAADAGKKIIIAECILKQGRAGWLLSVQQVRPACDLPGGGVKPDQATGALCAELQSKVCSDRELIVGIDSPPSIAAQFLNASGWKSWAKQFSRKFPTPELFRKATSMATSQTSTKTEPKRQTDIRHKTPFPPQNLRMYKQTWWAINGVYAPLASRGFIVAPCMHLVPKMPVAFEACPASLLKRLGLYSVPYKGSQVECCKRRKHLIKKLKQGIDIGGSSDATLQVEFPKGALVSKLVSDSGADYLDAVLAAVGSACATRRPDFPAPDDGEMLDIYKIEACVYC